MAAVKLRHAGALFLVGWYLMLPPLQFAGPGNDPYSVAIVDDAAPLSRCLPGDDLPDPPGMRQFLETAYERHAQERQNRAGQRGCQEAHRDMTRQVCVATGDPRLNEKWCVAEIQIIACGYSAQCTVRGGRTRATRAGRYTDGQAGR
jgi:hypothetical protein